MPMSTALGFDPQFDALPALGCPACAAESTDIEAVFRAADWMACGGSVRDIYSDPPAAFFDAVRVARSAQAELSARRLKSQQPGGAS